MSVRLLVVAVVAACLLSTAARAHAFLVSAEPAVGSTMGHVLAALRLEFSEPLELAFSGIELTDGSGSAVALKAARFVDATHKVIVTDLPILSPGLYHLKWHVVSVDTHRTDGDYTFTVKP
jgi:methionine-rich copper-binding protein CopC